MNESEYHMRADRTLAAFCDALEAADAQGLLDVECEGAVLTIGLASGKQYLVTKHAPSRELWVSSPLSGGLHFACQGTSWQLADGRELGAFVAGELAALAGIKVVL